MPCSLELHSLPILGHSCVLVCQLRVKKKKKKELRLCSAAPGASSRPGKTAGYGQESSVAPSQTSQEGAVDRQHAPSPGPGTILRAGGLILGADVPPGNQRLSLRMPLRALFLQRARQLRVERLRWLHVALLLHEGVSSVPRAPLLWALWWVPGVPPPQPLHLQQALLFNSPGPHCS